MEQQSKRLIWSYDDEYTKVKVINEREMPLFNLTHISALFGYEPELVMHYFMNQIKKSLHESEENATFVEDPDGIYCSVLIPLLLANVAKKDHRMVNEEIDKRMGWIGRIVEETMNDGQGDLYMMAMTKAARKLLGEAFGR